MCADRPWLQGFSNHLVASWCLCGVLLGPPSCCVDAPSELFIKHLLCCFAAGVAPSFVLCVALRILFDQRLRARNGSLANSQRCVVQQKETCNAGDQTTVCASAKYGVLLLANLANQPLACGNYIRPVEGPGRSMQPKLYCLWCPWLDAYLYRLRPVLNQ